MTTRILLFLVLASSLHAQGLSTQLSRLDPSRFPAIDVLLGVFSGAGKPVPGLTKDDFKLTEDGTPVAVISVEVDKAPISLALVLDRSGSMKGAMAALKSAATDFLRNLDPSDRVMLIDFSDKPTVRHELTTNRKDLVETVTGLEPEGSTSLYDAMAEAIQGLRRVEGRKLAVVFTDGRDQNNDGTRPQSTHTAKAAVKMAREQHTPLWTIALGKEVDTNLLSKISALTGGRSYGASDAGDLRKTFADILTDVRLQYRLTYGTPNEKRDGSWRTLQVTSAAHGQSGQGRARYQAPGTSPEPVAARPAQPPLARQGGTGSPTAHGLMGATPASPALNTNASGTAAVSHNTNIGVDTGNVTVNTGGTNVDIGVGGVDVGVNVGVNVDDVLIETGGTKVDTTGGNVKVEGAEGSVDIQDGNLKVEGQDGSVEAKDGNLKVEGEAGSVEIKDGAIEIEGAGGMKLNIPGVGGN